MLCLVVVLVDLFVFLERPSLGLGLGSFRKHI